MSSTGLLFLLLFMTGCVLAFVRHPIYGLITYVAVFYAHPPARWWGSGLPDLRWSLTAAFVTLLAVLVAKDRMGRTARVSRDGIFAGLLVFVGWTFIRWPFAFDSASHSELFSLFFKYALLVWLIVRCLDTEQHLKMFLWSHVLGCFYLGWVAYTEYEGGRFEGFGSPNINEANAASLHVATGIFIGAALFLGGTWRERGVLFGAMPFIVNAMITTLSRSGFLAAGLGGLVFNLFTPRRFRWPVALLSILALVLFMMLTNVTYWERIGSIKYAGADVEGVDTGAGRLVIRQAQLAMLAEHPFGCGHRCTAVLSTEYLSDEYLTTNSAGVRARSSHSTPLTMLVEHGVVGAALYVAALLAILLRVRSLRRNTPADMRFRAALIPGIGAALAGIFVSDIFVDNLILEVRFWLIAVLIVVTRAYEPAAAPQVVRPRRSPAVVPAAHSQTNRRVAPRR